MNDNPLLLRDFVILSRPFMKVNPERLPYSVRVQRTGKSIDF